MASESRPSGLLDVEQFAIDSSVLTFTLEHLAKRGEEGLEAFVLWGGRYSEGDRRSLRFTSALFPRQTAYKTEHGLLVTIESQSLFEVNKTFFERGEVLAAQVHTHPTEAYHSEIDDNQPVVTILGGLSIVIPDFARYGIADRTRWAWYRLRDLGSWEPLPPEIEVEVR